MAGRRLAAGHSQDSGTLERVQEFAAAEEKLNREFRQKMDATEKRFKEETEAHDAQATAQLSEAESKFRAIKEHLQSKYEWRKARIAKAQQLMERHKIDAIYIESGTSMYYFTGMRWGGTCSASRKPRTASAGVMAAPPGSNDELPVYLGDDFPGSALHRVGRGGLYAIREVSGEGHDRGALERDDLFSESGELAALSRKPSEQLIRADQPRIGGLQSPHHAKSHPKVAMTPFLPYQTGQ